MTSFAVDATRCIGCGRCVEDCIGHCLGLPDGVAVMLHEERCIGCQHCLAVCPTGAVSMLGHTAQDCLPLDGAFPSAESMEALVRGRRSVRRYAQCNADRATLTRLFNACNYAPTGVNARQLWVGTIDDIAVMTAFREELYRRMGELLEQGAIPDEPRTRIFRMAPVLWKERGQDVLLRTAPHVVVVSNAATAPCVPQDPLIYLSYFELLAHSYGLATTWCGLLYWCFRLFVPDMLTRLGMPDGHELGYCMLYGLPDVRYPRSIALPDAEVHRVTSWQERTARRAL